MTYITRGYTFKTYFYLVSENNSAKLILYCHNVDDGQNIVRCQQLKSDCKCNVIDLEWRELISTLKTIRG